MIYDQYKDYEYYIAEGMPIGEFTPTAIILLKDGKVISIEIKQISNNEKEHQVLVEYVKRQIDELTKSPLKELYVNIESLVLNNYKLEKQEENK